MFRLIWFELYKIWSKRSYRILIFSLILVNIYLIIYSNKVSENDYSLSEYGKLNSYLATMDKDEKSDYIKKLYATIHNIEIVENIQMYQAQDNDYSKNLAKSMKEDYADVYSSYYDLWESGAYFKYTTNFFSEKSLIDSYYDEWCKTQEYDDYLKGIKSQADVLSGISIFHKSNSDMDGFSAKNISKAVKDYDDMSSDNIVFSGTNGLVKALEFDSTGYLLAAAVFVIGGILIYEEKEKGLFIITKATNKGRICNIVAKMIALSVSTIVITCLFYTVNIAYYACTTGLGSLSGSIQSVPEYMNSVLDISAIGFIILSVLSRCVVYISVGLIIMFIAIIASYSFYTLLVYVAIFGYGLLMYNLVDATSKWNWIKYMNIVGFLKSEKILGNYINLNFFGEPVNLQTIYVITLIVVIAIAVFCNVLIFVNKKNLSSKGKFINSIIIKINNLPVFRKKESKIKSYNKRHTSLVLFEIYKSSVMYRTIIVLVLFAIFSFYKVNEINYYSSPGETYYKNYMCKIQGELTNEKESMILSDKERYDDAFAKLEEIQRLEDNNEISKVIADTLKQKYQSITAFYPAFYKVYENYEKVKVNSNLELVYEKGYSSFFGVGTVEHLNIFLQINVILILMLTPVFAMENKNDMKKLIRTTRKGRKDTILAKIIHSVIVSTIVYGILIIKKCIIISNNYGMNCATAGIGSIFKVNRVIESAPIYIVIIIFILVQLICTYIFMGVVLTVSSKSKNIVYGMLISTCVLVIPIVIAQILVL